MLYKCNVGFTFLGINIKILEEIIMFNKVKSIIVDSVNVDESKVTMEASLKDDLCIDSLDSVELVLNLETEFDIKIDDDEMLNIKTVGDIVKLLESK